MATGIYIRTEAHKKALSEAAKKRTNAWLRTPEALKKSGLTRRGKKFSEESRKRMSEAQKGKRNSPSTEFKTGHTPWIKGRTGIFTGEKSAVWISDRTKIVGRHNRNFHDPEYKQWHSKVKNRDGWKCKISNGDCSGRVEAHHILGWKDFPALRYEVNNGITLCHAHHPRKRAEEKRLSPYFQELVSASNEPI